MSDHSLTKQELRRYDRHIMLPEIGIEGQEKLKNARVLVIGAGGLGAPILQYLAASGIGKLGIIDYDTVNENNLQRQVLYGDKDIGKLKSIIVKEKLGKQNELTDYEVINLKINAQNIAQFIEKYDIIVDATDNFETRYVINDVCISLNKPFVYGAIYKYEGNITVFNYNNGPSLRCLFPYNKNTFLVPDANKCGVIGVLPAIIGSLQANEIIKLITGIGELLSGKLLIYNMLKNNMYKISFARNPKNFI